MPRYLVVCMKQDGTTEQLADVSEELHAINHITDAVYTSLLDGLSMELVATCTDGGAVSRYAHLRVHMDENVRIRRSTTAPSASPSEPGSPG